ncbi:RCC1 repeat- and reductase domain-containing protein [Frankia sp. CNm7]|uniref:RCC1 repeat- and reductase domain-containing protein n=1 Tax=Frankia nepalensis TaxID=1836974 RepID=A0A937RB92_9ACTN|nr:RCC1 repeat- and reductase domain-containing protein [Frankia nepalensis]MBL7501708.1 RCC1 repeat- and reductase domain-containing protein [Frankia nepalensis]MBL7511566.1 RCC1 repeat- and reductase domain-containing protein [Frankia nepalensis]MBL7518576.1 RCC1 repeat- and reductase domain-containing protein [Frankia nepalensis]MBL7626592.1 RCC1 repeat- and reductase domain-containing protein [Frankia nepalensis]
MSIRRSAPGPITRRPARPGRAARRAAAVLATVAVTAVVAPVAPAVAGSRPSIPDHGAAVSWGFNELGQLGDGTLTSRAVPGPVLGLTDGVVQVETEGYHSVALDSAGAVWTWGSNDGGQLGDGTLDGRTTPFKVVGLDNVVQVAAGYWHTLALRADGTVWQWGSHAEWVAGGGFGDIIPTPEQVPGLKNVRQIAAGGNHDLALRNDGTVWTWGSNGAGELGDGTFTRSRVPVQVPGLTDVTRVDGGAQHSMTLRADGTVWTWGSNSCGRLGNGSTRFFSETPVLVSALDNVVAISAGGRHDLAVVGREGTRGQVLAWGCNERGQLGTGTTTSSARPVTVYGLPADVVEVSTGLNHSFALRADGTLLSWGANSKGQLGVGFISPYASTPYTVGSGFRHVAGGQESTLATR